MWLFPVLNIFLLETPSADLMNAFCISPNASSISNLIFLSYSLPKGKLEFLFALRLSRYAKVFFKCIFPRISCRFIFQFTNLVILSGLVLDKIIISCKFKKDWSVVT